MSSTTHPDFKIKFYYKHQNETKRNKTKQNETRRNKTKQNETKQNKNSNHVNDSISRSFHELNDGQQGPFRRRLHTNALTGHGPKYAGLIQPRLGYEKISKVIYL